MHDAADPIRVVYALPDSQYIVALDCAPGMTAGDAVQQSGLLERCPEIAQHELILGVWGERVDPQHLLRPGDRVEISRPLLADPRDMRRDFVQGGRVMGGAALEKLRNED